MKKIILAILSMLILIVFVASGSAETTSDFSFDFLICEDSSCSATSNLFIFGETVYLDFSSDSDVSIFVTLISPSGDMETFTLPYNFVPSELGNYDVEITAYKEGYKDFSEETQFGVIEEDADIEYSSLGGGVSDSDSFGSYPVYILLGVVLMLIVFISIKLLLIIKKRKKMRASLKKEKVRKEKLLEKQFKEKEKDVERKEKKALRKLFRKKEKKEFGEKGKVAEEIKKKESELSKKKIELKKEFGKKLSQEKKSLGEREIKAKIGMKLKEIRRLLEEGNKKIDMKNRAGAKFAYRQIRKLWDSLDRKDKSQELYNKVLNLHRKISNS